MISTAIIGVMTIIAGITMTLGLTIFGLAGQWSGAAFRLILIGIAAIILAWIAASTAANALEVQDLIHYAHKATMGQRYPLTEAYATNPVPARAPRSTDIRITLPR